MSNSRIGIDILIDKLDSESSENTYHTLLEMGVTIIPNCINRYCKEHNPTIRSRLVAIVWQSRDESVVSFLGNALKDTESDVWKEAMDGLVSISTPEARGVLHASIESAQKDATFSREWLEYAEEALNQMRVDEVND